MGLLGKTVPDPMGAILGTGYVRFESKCGIHGLAKEEGKILHLLAVVAMSPGTGQFRKFVKKAKRKYKTIYVWEDWNPRMGMMLARYGFSPAARTEEDGEELTGWMWP